jgi:hypothetical protein
MSDFHIFRIPHSNFRIPWCLTPETISFLQYVATEIPARDQ